MFARSARVKAVIALCEEWYAPMDYEIRTLTERIDALWMEVEHHVFLMEQAEQKRDREAIAYYLERIIYYVTCIQNEVRSQQN